MIIRCLVLTLLISYVRTTENYGQDLVNVAKEYDQFSFWPSFPNAAKIIRLRKRDVQPKTPNSTTPILSEGGAVIDVNKTPAVLPNDQLHPDHPDIKVPDAKIKVESEKPTHIDLNTKEAANKGVHDAKVTPVTSTANTNDTNTNSTLMPSTPQNPLDLNNPGVLVRGIIVFGGFLVMAIAYFLFYRTKSSQSEINSKHNLNDANQFRYGVLQSEDHRDNLELSRVPLTMESDDDDDEDLEIFDLEQKKKSLSYVNLQNNDEDIVFEDIRPVEAEKDNLLLDIEEGPSDTLINWTNSGNKSIL